jgi:hypothetical protein
MVDTLLFFCIVGIAFIGLLMGLVIPKGPAASESSKYFLGLHRHQWGNIHFDLSLAFIVLVIIHLILAWKWIKGNAIQIFKKSWAIMLILTVIVSLLVIFLFWILYPRTSGAYEEYGVGAGKREQRHLKEGNAAGKEIVSVEERNEIPKIKEEEKHEQMQAEEHEENITRGRQAEDPSGILITGQMTLYDIEVETGIPARKIADRLGLPANVSLDENLGRLRKRYSFTMQELRDIVASLIKKGEKKDEDR